MTTVVTITPHCHEDERILVQRVSLTRNGEGRSNLALLRSGDPSFETTVHDGIGILVTEVEAEQPV